MSPPSVPSYEVRAVAGIPEVRPGDDLARLIAAAGPGLRDGDVLLVTSKIVSKAEGRIVRADSREDVIDAETVRVVARRGPLRIVENRQGLVMAAAGVDASNTEPGTVLLLPEDPDASAAAIRVGLRELLSVDVGVIVTDTFGRPWRTGLTDVAIGSAGVRVLDDLRGGTDAHGNPLSATIVATADELAAAGDLVKGKAAGLPVAVVRGLGHVLGEGSTAADLVRSCGRRHVPAGHLGGGTGSRDAAPYGTGLHGGAGGPRRGPPGGGGGRDGPGAAPHDAVAVRPARVGGGAAGAAGRDAGRVGRGPAAGRQVRGVHRQAGAARGRAAPGPVPGGAVHGDGRRARLRARPARCGGAGDVRGRDGRGRAELPGRAGRGAAGLGVGVLDDVLPGRGAQGARAAAGLGPDGRGGRGPRGRGPPGAAEGGRRTTSSRSGSGRPVRASRCPSSASSGRGGAARGPRGGSGGPHGGAGRRTGRAAPAWRRRPRPGSRRGRSR